MKRTPRWPSAIFCESAASVSHIRKEGCVSALSGCRCFRCRRRPFQPFNVPLTKNGSASVSMNDVTSSDWLTRDIKREPAGTSTQVATFSPKRRCQVVSFIGCCAGRMKCVESRNRWAESHPSVRIGKCDAGPADVCPIVITWNVSTFWLMYVYKYISMIEVIDISVDGRNGRTVKGSAVLTRCRQSGASALQ
jgi:hypothetical protein